VRLPLFLRRLVLLLLLLGLGSPASAEVLLTFYSRDFGATFPHAFFAVKGTVADDPTPIDTNFGFTAKTVSPAILMGPVHGEIVTMDAGYVQNSQPHLSLAISDEQYRTIMAVVEEWRAIPGKSYDLNKRNCVFFVAAVGRALGLAVVEERKLMKKPRSFLEDVTRRNAQIAASGGTVAR
jgi:hypothetical protein